MREKECLSIASRKTTPPSTHLKVVLTKLVFERKYHFFDQKKYLLENLARKNSWVIKLFRERD